METTHDVLIESINLEQSPRVRCEDNEDVIKEYRESYRHNDRFPPPVLYQTPTEDGFLIADGRHRIIAAREADQRSLICIVRKGTREECLAAALSANSRHGLRRTNADKRMCVQKALRQWPKYSDRQVAELVHVGHDLVATVRSVMVCKGIIDETPTRMCADGKVRTAPLVDKPIPVKIVTQSAPAQVEMPAKRDTEVAVVHTEPPPIPKGLRADTVPMILHVAEILEQLWDSHPSFRIPAFRKALSEIKVVREDLQLEFPGFGQSKPRRQVFKPPTVEIVREWCRRDNLPESHAEEFVSFYASKGWKIGKDPMVSAEQAFVRSRKWDSAKVNGSSAVPLERTIGQKNIARMNAKAKRL